MKKSIILCFMISTISLSLSAQSFHKTQTMNSNEEDQEQTDDEVEPVKQKSMKHSWEMGLNITYIFSSIIPQYPTYNYGLSENQFMLRKYFDRKNVLYIGALFNNSNSDFTNYDTLDGKTKSSIYSISLGYERYSQLGKRWRFYWGGDMGYAATNASNEYFQPQGSSYTKKFENITSSLIFKPKAGIVLDLSRRISLSTQMSLNVSWDNSKISYSYHPNPTYKDYSNTMAGFNSHVIYPAEVILRVRL